MEEMWTDMSLASTPAGLYHLHLRSYPAPYRTVLPDYLASSSSSSPIAVPQPPTPPPPTALSLSSSLEFTYLGSGGCTVPHSNSSSGDDPLMPPDPFGGGGGDIFSFGAGGGSSKRHGSAVGRGAGAGGGDRRQRRMIKNRESAARSRARKQAYANELALEVAQLKQERAMLLRREQELQKRLAMETQATHRPNPKRSRSAPP